MIRLARFAPMPPLAVHIPQQPTPKFYRFALYDPCQPLEDPEFIGRPFQLSRRDWGVVLEAIQKALDLSNDGRVVVVLPWKTRRELEGRAVA